jgi:superfamily I DNA/RNA helicase
MKLVLYDKCWDAILKLPKTIQKKVPEFLQKFRENPTSAAIHLEPISTFRDSSLRTARIDQKYRAIIRVPETGDVFHLLWIDNHDEAMDWAKSKIFSWNENTQSYQIFTAPESIEEEVAEKPQPQEPGTSGFLAGYSDEELEKIGVPGPLLPSVRQMETLADLEAMEKYLPVEAFENLFYLFDGEHIQRIIEEVEEGKVASADFDAQTQSANNQRSFFELTGDKVLNEMLSGELQKWKIYLHPSQRALVTGNFKGAVKVTGGAGTGKTVAALHRAKFLLEKDMGRGGKRILFTTFTKSLTRNLENELPGLRIDRSQIELTNIDRFAVEEAKRLGLIGQQAMVLDYFTDARKSEDIWEEVLDQELSEFDVHFLDAEWKNVILFNNIQSEEDYYRASRTGQGKRISRKDKMQIWKLVERYQARKKEHSYFDRLEVFNLLYNYYQGQLEKPYGHVIADEIQDFSNVELRLLRALVEEKPNDLFLVGDPLQSIYDRSINFSKAGINVRGRRSRRLKINYRTTEEIKRLAVATVRNLPFDDFDGEEERKNGYVSLRHGPRPEYLVFRGKGEEMDFILDKMRQYTDAGSIELSDICVGVRTRDGVRDIRSKLHRENIPYYDITTNAGTGDPASGVRLSTFHNMKGLEFKVVFLVDVNQRTLPYHPGAYYHWDEAAKEEHDRRELALMYVAMTRAMHELWVTGVGERSGVMG